MNNAAPITLTGPQLDYAIAAVKATRGIVVRAAARCHVSRACFYLWLAGTPELREAVDEAREVLAAEAQDCLIEIAKDPDHRQRFQACALLLETHGAALGYGKRELLLTVQQEPHAAALAILGVTKQAHPDIVIDPEEPKA